MIPGFKLIRRLVIAVVILGVLFVGANIYGERVAEDRIADAVRDTFSLEERPTVDLRAFPIVLSIVRGRVAGVEFFVDDLTVEGLRIRDLDVTLEDLAISGGLLGGSLSATVAGGSVGVRIRQSDVNAYLKDQGEDARVRLAEGTVRVRVRGVLLGARRTVRATGALRLRGTTLRFVPERVTVDGDPPPPGLERDARRRARFAVEIPELPGGFRLERVEPHRRFLELGAVLADDEIELRA